MSMVLKLMSNFLELVVFMLTMEICMSTYEDKLVMLSTQHINVICCKCVFFILVVKCLVFIFQSCQEIKNT